MTVPTHRRQNQELLDRLYSLLDQLGVRPSDVVRQLRREGKRIKFLSELSVSELAERIEEAEALVAKQTKGAS